MWCDILLTAAGWCLSIGFWLGLERLGVLARHANLIALGLIVVVIATSITLLSLGWHA